MPLTIQIRIHTYAYTYPLLSSCLLTGLIQVVLTFDSSNLFMRGKLRAKDFVRPAHVKAGFKCVKRHCIDNMYMKAVRGIGNSHRGEL